MVLTRDDKPAVFDQEAHITRENYVWGALLPHLDLQGKRVLDLGCGWGGFGKKAAEWGAEVLFVDGRKENLEVARKAGFKHKYIHQDIMAPYWHPPAVDISLCLGVLYHVSDPLTLLKKAACAPILAVETICMDHDGIAVVNIQEDTNQVDYSLNGGACRPSPGWLVNPLHEVGYPNVLELDVPTIPVTPEWPGAMWDWEFERTCGWRRNEHQLRKLYLATK